MKKCMLFVLLVAMSYQSAASQPYHKMMDLIRKNMSTKRGVPHDLTEYKAEELFSRENVFGEQEEILKLSDAGSRLFSALTETEKAKLPPISIAIPDSFAMKFYSMHGCCSKKYITTERPTVEDLDRQSHEVKFY